MIDPNSMNPKCCGNYTADWFVYGGKPPGSKAPCDGYLIQEVRQTHLGFNCKTNEPFADNTPPYPFVFWESLNGLHPDPILQNHPMKGHDRFGSHGEPNTYGYHRQSGTIKFICASRMGLIPGQNLTNLVPPWEPSFRFGWHTETPPKWFEGDSEDGGPAATHKAGSLWCCCWNEADWSNRSYADPSEWKYVKGPC